MAVPTTAGTGAETNAFGVVTDPLTQRKFYVGHATLAARRRDPRPGASPSVCRPLATAATGMDALTHALESYLSVRANPWSDGIALQVIRMVAALPAPRLSPTAWTWRRDRRCCWPRTWPASAMATTGLGLCHAIGHSLGGRFDIAHGVALTMVLPARAPVQRHGLPGPPGRRGARARAQRRRRAARTPTPRSRRSPRLADLIGMTQRMADFGITGTDFGQIAADALDDEVLANTPRQPTADDIHAILLAARQLSCRRRLRPLIRPTDSTKESP